MVQVHLNGKQLTQKIGRGKEKERERSIFHPFPLFQLPFSFFTFGGLELRPLLDADTACSSLLHSSFSP
jgi:hypothetical protein